MNKYHILYFCFIALLSNSCQKEETEVNNTYFKLIDSKQSGIEFSNDLIYDRDFNIYTYRNFYNGGGVAIGDINNDGLADVYFTSNMAKNKLYINKGDWKFEDQSASAKVEGESAWSTGVCMVDINADGWLDIYVCNSGDVDGDNKKNELFINLQNGSFEESAEEYGLADSGYSTHSAFFDMDKDGDLDMYLLNNSYRAISSFNPKINFRDKRDLKGGDKLFRNDAGNFTDISEEAGIYGSEIGFGLGVTVGDLNNDGWDDIYICNDFFEKDYLYINNQNGTFTEDLENQMKSISVASMGADMADLDNDGMPEIFVTEMLPNDERRIKTKTTFEDWDKYAANIENGYYHQFTRNMLHKNNGDQTFSEVGRFAGVEASDWSWGALLADFNNDGKRDIFIANGINKDLTDQDFINYLSNEETMKKMTAGNKVNYKELIDVIPSERIPNRLFMNKGNLKFEDQANLFGVNQPSHSNGSAYGDLDNDGDLDLVVNNINMPCFIYQNNTPKQNFIQFTFTGIEQNKFAIGTKVKLFTKDEILYDQFMPTKGFQSSMDYKMHFGLGKTTKIDKAVVTFPNGKQLELVDLEVNKIHHVEMSNGKNKNAKNSRERQILIEGNNTFLDIPFQHRENKFVDFDKDRLLFHMNSTEGPKAAIADLNNDGVDDIFICGAKDQPSVILIHKNGKYQQTNQSLLEQHAENEDQDVAFVDLDNDGDLDIYVCSGGREFNNQSNGIRDRSYLNNGSGKFTLSTLRILPTGFIHSGAVDVADIDDDGDQDLVISERLKSFQYGVPCSAFLIENEKGEFKDRTEELAPELMNLGLYTDIKWADLDLDGVPEIVACGKYMPISILSKDESGIWKKQINNGLEDSEGWWNSLEIVDIDKDGDLDIIAGNHGTNSRFRASPDKPLCLHVNDFDKNGSIEQILCTYQDTKSYPLVLRHDLLKQLPGLRKRLLKYEDYALKTVEEIFRPEERANMLTLEVKEMETCVFLNKGGKFEKVNLPSAVQYTPIYATHAEDLNGDGHIDILLGGNLYESKPEVGRYDASRGVFLSGDGKGNFNLINNSESGFTIDGQVRDIKKIKLESREAIVVFRNNDKPVVFTLSQ